MTPEAGDPPTREPEQVPKVEDIKITVSWTQVVASAAAAVTAGLVSSFFGVAGTIVGTLLASIIATTGSAVYNANLRRTQHRLRTARARRALAAQAARAEIRGASAGPTPAEGDPPPADPSTPPDPPDPPMGSRTPLSEHRRRAVDPDHHSPDDRPVWRRRAPLALAGVLTALLAVGGVTAAEMLASEPLATVVGSSTSHGGTSFFGSKPGTPTPSTTTTTTTPARTGTASTTTTTSTPAASTGTATTTTTTSTATSTTTAGLSGSSGSTSSTTTTPSTTTSSTVGATGASGTSGTSG